MTALRRVLGRLGGATVTPHPDDPGRLVIGYPCGLVVEVPAGVPVADLLRATLAHTCTTGGDAPTRAGARTV